MKKIITVFGTIALATGIFFSSNVKADQSLNLTSLVAVNSANAECPKPEPYGGGKCLPLSQICVGDPGNNECRF